MCGDVVMGLVQSALKEEDEGVSSTAMEALGRLLLDGTGGSGGGRPGHRNQLHARYRTPPSDPPFCALLSSIRFRILESALVPRARRLVTRAALYRDPDRKVRCLPFLSDLVALAYRTFRARRAAGGEGEENAKGAHARRWMESDAPVLAGEFAALLLLPVLEGGGGCGGGCGCGGVCTQVVWGGGGGGSG